jgi:putative DNA-invertase from lambdoid prophage Rac
MSANMTVFGYTRVSTVEQASDDRTSLETQRQRIAQAAAAGGLAVDTYVNEAGVSGSKPLSERPLGGPLLAGLQRGDTLIVAKMDRAFRNAADALVTAGALKDRKIDLIISDMGSEPVTQNGVSRMFFGMLALVAEFERDRLRERVAEGRTAKRISGGHIGGATPFGYRKNGTGRTARLEPDPEQQVALGSIRAMGAEGLSSRAISAALRERHNLKLSHVSVRAILAKEQQGAARIGQ